MHKDKKLEHLAGIPLFVHAGRTELEQIARCCTQAGVAPGQVLCRQGGVARQVLLVEDGHARVTVDGQQIDDLVRGDVFGDAAALATARYDATLSAVDPMRVLVFTPAEFSTVLALAPFVAERMLRARAARCSAALERRDGQVTVPAQRSQRRLPHAHA